MKRFVITALLTLSVVVPAFAPQAHASAAVTSQPSKQDTGADVQNITPGMKKSDYAFPYPGILPDHPLYALKKIRDAILDKLIVDPVRKAEFYLLQADKHLSMTMLLLEKKKPTYAEGTIAASTDFMDKVIKHLTQLKSAKKPVPAYIIDRVEKSMEKHIEVLTELQDKAESDVKESLSKALVTMKQLQGQVAGLR